MIPPITEENGSGNLEKTRVLEHSPLKGGVLFVFALIPGSRTRGLDARHDIPYII